MLSLKVVTLIRTWFSSVSFLENLRRNPSFPILSWRTLSSGKPECSGPAFSSPSSRTLRYGKPGCSGPVFSSPVHPVFCSAKRESKECFLGLRLETRRMSKDLTPFWSSWRGYFWAHSFCKGWVESCGRKFRAVKRLKSLYVRKFDLTPDVLKNQSFQNKTEILSQF